MADLATLVIETNTRGVDEALAKLKALAGQASATAAATEKVARTATQASSTIRSAGLSFGTLAASFTAGLTAANLLDRGIGALIDTYKRAVSEAAEAERQHFTLEAVLRATGEASGKTAQQIEQLADAIGKTTLATVDDVTEAATQLLTFRSIAGETFDRTLRAAQDLAAVGFGTVSTAAVQLGKALESPEQGLSALRRAGVTFTDAQIEMIKNFEETGDKASAMNEILKAVEQQVGGAGAAQASGLSGAVHRLSEEWENLLENIGKSGPWQAASGFLADTFKQINDFLNPSLETARQRLADLQQQRQNATFFGINISPELDVLIAKQQAVVDQLTEASRLENMRAQSARESATEVRVQTEVENALSDAKDRQAKLLDKATKEQDKATAASERAATAAAKQAAEEAKQEQGRKLAQLAADIEFEDRRARELGGITRTGAGEVTPLPARQTAQQIQAQASAFSVATEAALGHFQTVDQAGVAAGRSMAELTTDILFYGKTWEDVGKQVIASLVQIGIQIIETTAIVAGLRAAMGVGGGFSGALGSVLGIPVGAAPAAGGGFAATPAGSVTGVPQFSSEGGLVGTMFGQQASTQMASQAAGPGAAGAGSMGMVGMFLGAGVAGALGGALLASATGGSPAGGAAGGTVGALAGFALGGVPGALVGGLAGGLLGGQLFGQHGFDVRIPGMGGADRIPILSWVQPGERLTATPPGKPGPGSSVHVTYAPNIDARGADADAVVKVMQRERQARLDFQRQIVDRLQRDPGFRKMGRIS